VLLLAGLAVIVTVRALERWVGKTWKAAGLLPWIYLALHFHFAGAEMRAPLVPGLQLPLTIAPLLVVGLGWTVLRGMQPGRVRRQEYGFALTWLASSVLLAPFIPAGHPHDPVLAAMVSVLPPGLLLAARGARALWESEEGPLARGAVLVIAYLPVLLFGGSAATSVLGGPDVLRTVTGYLSDWTPRVLLVAAGFGALSQLLTVRPDARPIRVEEGPRQGRRGRRGGRGRARGGRRRREGSPRR
jgi:hypothetical protein